MSDAFNHEPTKDLDPETDAFEAHEARVIEWSGIATGCTATVVSVITMNIFGLLDLEAWQAKNVPSTMMHLGPILVLTVVFGYFARTLSRAISGLILYPYKE